MKKLSINKLLVTMTFCVSGLAGAQTGNTPPPTTSYPNATGTLNGNTVETQNATVQQEIKDCNVIAGKDKMGNPIADDVDTCLKAKGIKPSMHKNTTQGQGTAPSSGY